MTVMKYGHTDCSNCDQPMKVWLYDEDSAIREGQFVQVINGLCVDVSGHYNGFNDDAFSGGGVTYYPICHDCSLAVFRALSEITKKNIARSHQPEDPSGPSCCEYSFKVETDLNGDYVTYAGDRYGGWTIIPEEDE